MTYYLVFCNINYHLVIMGTITTGSFNMKCIRFVIVFQSYIHPWQYKKPAKCYIFWNQMSYTESLKIYFLSIYFLGYNKEIYEPSCRRYTLLHRIYLFISFQWAIYSVMTIPINNRTLEFLLYYFIAEFFFFKYKKQGWYLMIMIFESWYCF